jgi:5-(carboxyamino)imidazole ribonucleotide synthase
MVESSMKIGILGGGQLARMMALAAHPLNIKTICIDPGVEACAGDVTEVHRVGYDQHQLILEKMYDVDVVTIETENIPLSCASFVANHKLFYPSLKALEVTQDRLYEKTFLRSLEIPTAAFIEPKQEAEIHAFLNLYGESAILKTRRLGYDGKGQERIKSQSDVAKAWQALKDQAPILEQFIPFEREFSLIAVRSSDGECRYYPLVHNIHQHGILHTSEVSELYPDLQQQAQQYAEKILDALAYVGVLTIEMFYDGHQLLVNELAPRVHNSGHWTIEGAMTSQFENHLRAICGLPLGETSATGHAWMWNGVGQMPAMANCLSVPGSHYHDYNKSARPNRKLGHVTLVADHVDIFAERKKHLLQTIHQSLNLK